MSRNIETLTSLLLTEPGPAYQTLSSGIANAEPDIDARLAAAEAQLAQYAPSTANAEQARIERQGYAGALANLYAERGNGQGAFRVLEAYVSLASIAYYREARSLVGKLAPQAKTTGELDILRAQHQRYHHFVQSIDRRLHKARPASRREKLRTSRAHLSGFTDSDMLWPIVAATCTVESPADAVAYIEKNPHSDRTTMIALSVLFNTANSLRKPVPPSAHQQAADLLVGADDHVLSRSLRTGLAAAGPLRSGHTQLPLV